MVDREFVPQTRQRRKRTMILNQLCNRCMGMRIAFVKRASVAVLLLGVIVFLTRDVHNEAVTVNTPMFQDEKANELLQALYELELPSSTEELTALNEEFANLEPAFILQWAHHILLSASQQNLRHDTTNQLHPLVQVTSFGPTGLVILHMLSQLHLLKDVPVLTLDTLHLFKESYTFYDTIQHHPDFNQLQLTITKPIDNGHEFTIRDEFDTVHNGLWKADPKKYTKLTKQDPLNKVFNNWNVEMWITGRRRSQGGERTGMQVLEFEFDEHANDDVDNGPFHHSKGRWKLNPLAFWTYDQVWKYIRAHKIPYNPLYDQGYTSIGDEMTTRFPDASLQNNESFERSGRFVGLNQTECGLHSHRAKINAKKEEAAAAGEEWKVPTLPCDKCIDLNLDNFNDFIKNGDSDVLLEFFSPYCGSCQEFAPTMARIADHLASSEPTLKVARFDITEHDAPPVDDKKVFEVEATPTLYRVKYSPFAVELYTGEHDYHDILRWLGKL